MDRLSCTVRRKLLGLHRGELTIKNEDYTKGHCVIRLADDTCNLVSEFRVAMQGALYPYGTGATW